MAKDRVATINGTFLLPTISKNRRLYTKENIGKAVERMNKRLGANEDLPLTMFPSHTQADTDNALMTIGRITKVTQENDGSATFEADIADTSVGRDMAALVTPENPYVKGLSIRGAWMGQMQTVEDAGDGKEATTSSDLDVFGIDWTGRPGVEGAQITSAQLAESVGVDVGNLITESADGEAVFFDETSETPIDNRELAAEKLREAADLLEAGDAPGNGKLPYGTDASYADPGYQADKKKRYPLDSAKRVKAAWSYINVADNASKYSSAQLARIKSKIKSAAKKYGINVSEDLEQLADDIRDLLEAYACMSIDNGGGSVSVSGYTDDAGKLAPMARRIAMSAIIGLNALDPDADGDIDLQMPDGSSDSSVSGPESETPDDNNMEASNCSECGAEIPENALFCPTCAAPVANAESNTETNAETQIEAASTDEKESQVATETQTPAADAPIETDAPVPTPEAAPTAISMSTTDLAALVRGAVEAAVMAVAPAPVVETEPTPEPVVYTQEQRDADIAAAVAEAKQEQSNEDLEAARAAGIIPRHGFTPGGQAGQFGAPATETKVPTLKELSEMSDEDLISNSREAFMTNPILGRLLTSGTF